MSMIPGQRIGGLTCVAFSADGKMLASASGEKTVELWEIPAKK